MSEQANNVAQRFVEALGLGEHARLYSLSDGRYMIRFKYASMLVTRAYGDELIASGLAVACDD